MLSRGFFSDGGANCTAARPYPLAPLATSPRSAGEDDSRRDFHFVIAGLDPPIHADAPLARIDRTDRVRRIYGFHKTRARIAPRERECLSPHFSTGHRTEPVSETKSGSGLAKPRHL